jgi:hypothetical protein
LLVVLVPSGANRNGNQEEKRPEIETLSEAKGEQALYQKEQPPVVSTFGVPGCLP